MTREPCSRVGLDLGHKKSRFGASRNGTSRHPSLLALVPSWRYEIGVTNGARFRISPHSRGLPWVAVGRLGGWVRLGLRRGGLETSEH